MKKIARISILATLVLLLPSTFPANGSTTRVWEAVNILVAGVDTLANNSTVTVSFGNAGRLDPLARASAGGAPYLTDGSCITSPCAANQMDGTVRFTFGAPQTHIQIHYGFIEANDPERVMSSEGEVDFRNVSSGGNLVSSAGGLISGQGAAENLANATFPATGIISTGSGVSPASGTVELRFASPGVNFIEFQNDFPDEPINAKNFGQNLVGLSLPVEYAQVTFNANSGSGTMSAQSAARATNLSTNTFNYSGHTFAGWNTAANGSGSPFADAASFGFAADTIFYAQWTANPVGTTTQTTTAPAPTSLLATTGADNSRTILIAGTGTLLAIAGLMIFGIRRQLRKAE